MYQCGFVVGKVTLELTFFQALHFPLPVHLSVNHAPYLPVIRNWCSLPSVAAVPGTCFHHTTAAKNKQHSSSMCSKTFLTNKG